MAPFNFIFLSFEVLPLQCAQRVLLLLVNCIGPTRLYSHPDNDNYSLAWSVWQRQEAFPDCGHRKRSRTRRFTRSWNTMTTPRPSTVYRFHLSLNLERETQNWKTLAQLFQSKTPLDSRKRPQSMASARSVQETHGGPKKNRKRWTRNDSMHTHRLLEIPQQSGHKTTRRKSWRR